MVVERPMCPGLTGHVVETAWYGNI